MKTTLLLTIALFIQAPGLQASPPATKKQHAARICEMCKHKELRVMMLHELTNCRERKQEVVHILKADPEFVEMFGNETTGGG